MLVVAIWQWRNPASSAKQGILTGGVKSEELRVKRVQSYDPIAIGFRVQRWILVESGEWSPDSYREESGEWKIDVDLLTNGVFGRLRVLSLRSG
jgi:hypothetical protein